MTIQEFAEKLKKFVELAQKEGIPDEDIINELEDLQSSMEEDKSEEEEEKIGRAHV